MHVHVLVYCFETWQNFSSPLLYSWGGSVLFCYTHVAVEMSKKQPLLLHLLCLAKYAEINHDRPILEYKWGMLADINLLHRNDLTFSFLIWHMHTNACCSGSVNSWYFTPPLVLPESSVLVTQRWKGRGAVTQVHSRRGQIGFVPATRHGRKKEGEWGGHKRKQKDAISTTASCLQDAWVYNRYIWKVGWRSEFTKQQSWKFKSIPCDRHLYCKHAMKFSLRLPRF